MLRRQFDPQRPYRVVAYLRMSDPGQNARSPEQQHDTIVHTLERTGYPWRIVKSYTDAGKTGRLKRNRDGYQRMLRELKAKTVVADLILVDTISRFGRVDDLEVIRAELWNQHGILVLAANRNFLDPTSPEGRTVNTLENHFASEESRVKAHQVLRGKRDTIKQGYWPGGPIPFGFRLKCVSTEKRMGRPIHHHILEPDPESAPVIRLLFQHAAENPDLGQSRLARFLNGHRSVPEKFKPFHSDTVGSWLDQTLYAGELVWGENATGIIGDRRVIEPNPSEEVIIVSEFCEPIVSRPLWEQVQAARELRRRSRTSSTTANTDEKLIQPKVRGLVYKYLLSGLVRCDDCGAAMIANSSTPYITKSGDSRTYAAYACPNSRNGACSNSVRVSEQWLREMVVQTLCNRLFPHQWLR